MKRIFISLLILSLYTISFAQSLLVTHSSFEKVALTFTADSLAVEEVSVAGNSFSLVGMENFGRSYNAGAPQLPLLTKLLQVPVCDSIIVNIIAADYEEYAATDLGITHPLYPSQPSLSKSAENQPFVYNQTIYATDTFYALSLVSVEKTGIRRDLALANVHFSPVQYNPVTNRIRIYHWVDVELTFVNTDMTETRRIEKYASPMFALDTTIVVNKLKSAAKSEYKGVPIKYLIIAHSMFSSNSDLAAFVAWKRRLGYLVEVAYTGGSTVGTTTSSIKNYIQNKYNSGTTTDPAPTYLLLVGDVAQIPAFSSTVEPGGDNETHYTDLYYATLAGNDNIPDCYYGRLSATNATQLKNQIDKILMYEQYTMPDPSYLGKAVLIAGTDNSWSPTHANGHINYASGYVYANSSSNPNPYHFTTVYKHLHNCSSQAATIRSEIGAGVGFANYTAHGSEEGWYEPAFETSHIASMQNANKYGLLIGNCCLSGSFQQSECFAEALLRTANKGAMGYIGASKETYWDQDYYWAVGVRSNITANPTFSASNLGMYDKLFHTKSQVGYNNWVSTIGGILQGGNLAVEASSSSSTYKKYYWEIYHCFGDPSVRVFLGIPNTMTVAADGTLPVSSTSLTVQAVPYAYVALKKGTTEYVAAAFADASGTATLTFPTSLETGNYELVVLAQNYIPYFQNVLVEEEGNCLSPTNTAVSNVTAFTATLSWTGSGDSYNIQLKTGTTDWVSAATNVTATSYLLTGLQENTAYQVRVQSVCGDETSSWRTVSFTTPVACPTPTGLTCGSVTATTANLGWTENGSATNWILQYGTNSTFASGSYEQITVSGTPAKMLSGLIAETTYYARVKAACGGAYGESLWSNVCTFLPSAIVTIGSGSATDTYLPTTRRSKYSLTQQIYTAAELGSPGNIESISFYKSNSTSCNRNLDIYMVSTSKSSFSSSSDWIAVSSADRVFSGTVNFASNSWTTIQLNTPFIYDGTRNVAVIVDDNSGSSSILGSASFLTFDAASQAIRINGSTNYNPASPASYSGTVETSKNQIRIYKSTPCPAPANVTVNDVSGTGATINWDGEGDSYNVRYRTASTGGTYFFDDFEAGVDDWIVIRNGDGTESTDWHIFNPNNFTSNSFDAHSGTYTVIGRSWASDPYNVDNWLISPAVTLDGTLRFWVKDDGSYHEHYDIYVSTTGNAISDFTLLHSPGNASSTWSEVSVDLSGYHGVTGYIAFRLTDYDQDYLVIDDVSISANGTSAGEWQSFNSSTSNFANITGLTPETSYEVQVQSDCGTGSESVWSDAVLFTTGQNAVIPTYVDIIGDTNVCANRVTTLTAASDVEGTFLWSTGATSPQVIVGAGTYTVTVTSVSGHELSTSVTVTSFPEYTISESKTVCESELPYIWNGITFNAAGLRKVTLETVAGCDSTVVMTLTVNPTFTTTDTATICESELPYSWSGTDCTESGEYTQTFTAANGCDSTVTLHLTILHGTHNVETATACENFTWHGTTFTTLGTYTYEYTNTDGCESVDTLHLTVNHPQHQSETVTAYDSLFWNGATYTATGDYTYAHLDANGCTQVDTLHLTVYNSSYNEFADTACESYEWDGETYTQTGDFTRSYHDIHGADSIVTLHLTIHHGIHNVETATACESFTWHGTTFTTSGTYTYEYTNTDGCASVDTLHLTVNYAMDSEFSIEWMDDMPYTWNGQEYTESGDYTQTLQTVDGCDSVVTLHLTIVVGVDVYDAAAVYIAPNPAKEVCRIVGLETAPLSVDLFDIRGKLLMRARSTEFDVSTLPSGMYMVKVNTGDRIINLKLIRQ